MSRWTLDAGWWDLFWPQIGRGVALGFMFAPLSVATLRALPPGDILQGAGLYNLFRQTGGSLGVAALATLVDHRSALHQAYLAESLTPFSAATQQRLAALAAGLVQHGIPPAQALEGAHRVLDRILAAQSSVLAFRDCYLAIMILFLLLIPLVPLLRRPPVHASAPEPSFDHPEAV
jgi:DHA2 family multidrug resistance protein